MRTLADQLNGCYGIWPAAETDRSGLLMTGPELEREKTMTPSDIYHALRHTPLRDSLGNATAQITHPYDREALALLVTRDRDVIVDLLQEALAEGMTGSGMPAQVTGAIEAVYRRTVPFSGATQVAAIGESLMRNLLELLLKHIDDNAADWLVLARQYAAELEDGDAMGQGYEARREATA